MILPTIFGGKTCPQVSIICGKNIYCSHGGGDLVKNLFCSAYMVLLLIFGPWCWGLKLRELKETICILIESLQTLRCWLAHGTSLSSMYQLAELSTAAIAQWVFTDCPPHFWFPACLFPQWWHLLAPVDVCSMTQNACGRCPDIHLRKYPVFS